VAHPATEAELRPARLLASLRSRSRQRRQAAGQLVFLARRAGPGLLVGTLATHLAAGLLPIVFIVGVGLAVQDLVDSSATGAGAVSGWLWLAVASFVLQQPLSAGQLVLSQAIARRVDAYCSARLMRFALHRAPLRALERDEIASEAADGARALEHMAWTPGTATEGALALIPRYVQLAGAVTVVAVAVHPWAALVAAVVALVNRRGQTAAFFRWGQLTRRLAPARRRLAYLRDLATGTRAAKEIRTLGLVDWIDDRYATESRAYLEPLWAGRRRLYGRPFLVYTLIGLIGAVAVLLALTGLPAGTGRLAELTMGLQATVLCLRFGVIFPESDVKMVHGRAALESLLDFERRSAELVEPGDRADPARATADRRAGGGTIRATAPGRPAPPAPAPVREIAFERVGFAYEAGRPVLDGLDLRIPVGTSTAVVGVNGAGKTTLVKLLTALYRPTDGRLSCDGVDLRDLDPESWRRRFAVTFQDFVHYELSLRENVAMAAVEQLADDAGIATFSRRLSS